MTVVDAILRERRPPLNLTSREVANTAVVLVCVSSFVSLLDTSIVSLALPTLEKEFHQSVTAISWVSLAYIVTSASLAIPFGRLGDMYGRKTIFALGYLLFAVASALCGFAPDLQLLVLARGLQGLGGAMLFATFLGIMSDFVPKERLQRAIGYQLASASLGVSLGPVLGGFLISTVGWRWIFFATVIPGLVGAAAAWAILPATHEGAPEHGFNWLGALLLVPALTALLVLSSNGSAIGFAEPAFWILLAVFVGTAVFFVVDQLRESTPLVDLGLFRSAGYSSGTLAVVLTYALIAASLFITPFFLERVHGHSAGVTGLLMTPLAIAFGLGGPASSWLSARIGGRAVEAIGMVAAFAALLALAVTAHGTPYLITAGIFCVLGFGMGVVVAPAVSSAMGSTPRSRHGIAGSVLYTGRNVGMGLGIAAVAAVLAWQLSALGVDSRQTDHASLSNLTQAFHYSFWFLAALAASVVLVVLFVPAGSPASEPEAAPADAGG